MRELLVIDRPFRGKVASLIRSLVHVVQEAPPHVIIVEGDAASVGKVASLPGVSSGRQIDALKAHLSFSESFTVDAWLAGKAAAPATRDHDNMNWGTFGKGP